MAKKNNDPLEAAKIATKPLPEPPPTPPEMPAPVPEPVIEVSDAIRGKKYRVKVSTTVSLSGQLTRLNVGDIVQESSYGPVHMQRILEANVPLEEVD
jgi:hypothetical protein